MQIFSCPQQVFIIQEFGKILLATFWMLLRILFDVISSRTKRLIGELVWLFLLFLKKVEISAQRTSDGCKSNDFWSNGIGAIDRDDASATKVSEEGMARRRLSEPPRSCLEEINGEFKRDSGGLRFPYLTIRARIRMKITRTNDRVTSKLQKKKKNEWKISKTTNYAIIIIS